MVKYNTQNDRLRLKNYGRHVQTLVDQLLLEPNREVRRQKAFEIINVMRNITYLNNPTREQIEKLWNHLAFLAQYRLDIDFPCTIEKLNEKLRPQRIDYPQRGVKIRHYGRNIERALQLVAAETDSTRRQQKLRQVLSRMQLNLAAIRRDGGEAHRIAQDAEILSNGNITAQEALEVLKPATH